MKFVLSFDVDNAAFDGVDETCSPWPPAIATQLRDVAKRLEQHAMPMTAQDGGRVVDCFGNTVGEWKLTDA